MKIHLLPSDHEFECDNHEILLDAALGSGLSVVYGCNSGNCGACIARIISGDSIASQHADYVFSRAEKAGNYLLMCCCKPSSDMVLEVGELSIDDIPEQHIKTKVSKLTLLTESVMELELRTPRSQSLKFMAGQAIKFLWGDRLSTAYSISSCPCNGMLLTFHIPRTADDFSKFVFGALKKNNKIDIKGPFGQFSLQTANKKIIFIAYGSGFGVMKSLLEHVIDLDGEQVIYLYRVNSQYMENYCRSIVDALDGFTVRYLENKEVIATIIADLKLTADTLPEYDIYISADEKRSQLWVQQFTLLGETRLMINPFHQ